MLQKTVHSICQAEKVLFKRMPVIQAHSVFGTFSPFILAFRICKVAVTPG